MIEKTISRTRAIGAATLTATVSPCSWMYPGHGLQIQIQLAPNGGTAFLHSKGKAFFYFTMTPAPKFAGLRYSPIQQVYQ